MKIIFLDVNGVLDSFTNNAKMKNKDKHYFDWKCLYNLYILVKLTNAYIVVSSDWKRSKANMKKLQHALDFMGIGERVLGTTPVVEVKNECYSYVDRGLEIKEYLANHECENFVILDDIKWNLDDLEDHLVLTHPSYGLTDEDVLKAREIFNNKSLQK